VRSRVEEVLQVPANCEIDPTTAVALLAACALGYKTQRNF
jgi:molecular chaperone DnaK